MIHPRDMTNAVLRKYCNGSFEERLAASLFTAAAFDAADRYFAEHPDERGLLADLIANPAANATTLGVK